MQETPAFQPGPPSIVLRGALLLDGTHSGPIRNAAVWIEDGRVRAVGPAHELVPEGPEALDLGEVTILPGLVDTHVHLISNAGPDLAAEARRSPAARTVVAVANARRNLEAGVTLVRDLGAPADEAIAVGRAVEAGEVRGARVVAAGPAMTMTGGHVPYLGRVTDGVEAMRAAVRANLALGAACIKVIATGGVLTEGIDPRRESYTEAELRALVDEAHRFGLPVAAHAIGEGGIHAALRAGVDSIEHGMFLDDQAIELLLKTGARYCPTFSAPAGILGGPSVPEWTKERARPAAAAQAASFRRAVAAGVRIVAGTDAGTPDNPSGSVAGEVAFMVRGGLAVEAAIRAATSDAADLLGTSDRGRLTPGAAADVLVVDGDALTDVEALQRPVAVFQDGVRVR